jgi:hypothetical protein
MKKIVRRARQNKHKRIKTAAMKQTDTSVKEESEQEQEEEEEEEEKQEKPEKPEKSEKPEKRTVHIPTMGREFPARKLDSNDFAM